MSRMEALPEIQETLSEIERRTPYALRIAFGIGFGSLPVAASGERDDVASFAASLALCLHARGGGDGDPMECDEVPRALRMASGSCYVRDHDEDAHFCHPKAGVVGVADGVGGYRATGADAGAFSRALMSNAFAEVSSAASGTRFCPYTLLERAYQQAVASRTPAASTAVILSLAGDALRWAYVGDSAFAVFRGGKIVHRSQPQQLYFNCPFQLRAGGGNSVTEAAVGEVPVKEGDVVVIGSDGLFDNVFDATLEQLVQLGTALGFTPKNMADIVAGFAFDMAISSMDSPFSVTSREQRGTSYSCGKPDDITVVIAFIVS